MTSAFAVRRRILTALQWVLAAAVVIAVVVAVQRNWAAVAPRLDALSWGTLALALGASLLAPLTSMLAWRVLLAALGSRPALPVAASIFFVGQLGKYLPGSVWPVVAQAEMGSRVGIPRSRMGAASVLTLGLGILGGGFLGLLALPSLFPQAGALEEAFLAVAVVLALLTLMPPVLNRLIGSAFRWLRRPEPPRLSGRVIAVSMLLVGLSWLSMGVAAYVVAAEVDPGARGGRLAVLAVAGYALAGVLGMVAVVVPAGVGVRDGLLAVVLSAVMPLAAAGAVAIVLRFLTLVADIGVALGGALWARGHRLLGSPDE